MAESADESSRTGTLCRPVQHCKGGGRGGARQHRLEILDMIPLADLWRLPEHRAALARSSGLGIEIGESANLEEAPDSTGLQIK